jgi:hypothetical protein
LDVDGAGTSSMTLVDLYQCNSTVAQVWEVNATTGTIINPHSGLCLDDKAASTKNGNQIWIYTCNGTAAQKWVVTASSTPPSSTPPTSTPPSTPPTTPPTTSEVAPTITSAANVTLTAGQAGSFTVKDTGTPAPTLSESGTLPSGISFNSTSGVLSGTASAAGTYKISFTASNGVSPDAVQSFVLAVVSAPTTGGGGSSSNCTSPFLASYFCQTVTGDTVLSNSSSLVTDFVNQYTQNYGTVGVNADTNYAIPIYRASASQSLSQVSFDSADCSGDSSFGSFQVPVPSGAVPAQGTDHSLIVYQASTNTDWEFWEFGNGSNGGYTACAGGEITNVSTSNGVFPTSGGQLASSGISYLATMITNSDINSGAINHAIALQLIYCNGSYVAPARTNYDCSGGSIPYGQYFRFPSSLAMPSGLTSLGQMVFKAIQNYGLVVTDHAGAVTVEGEDPAGWDLTNNTTDNPIGDAMDGQASYSVITSLPWADLQAISSPALP